MSLRIRRGTDLDRQSIVFEEAEILYTTDTKLVYIGDGTTSGGLLVGSVGSGNTIYTTEIEPATPNEGDGWFTPSTGELQIYESGAFQNITVDIAQVAITINDGFF